MNYVSELVRRLSDPSLTWNIASSFGGWIRTQGVSSIYPQTLHVCDEIICIPTRFSEYFYWQDGKGNLVSRIFPTLQEAWDHQNEANPNISPPYDGKLGGVVGYSGYFFFIDLTDGTNKTRVYIAKRTYPELQILIFNKGSLTVRVNDPPSGFGLSKYTTGTKGSGYTDLGQNQYVVFYKSTQPQVDATNGVFAQSPLGSSKKWSYEVYVDGIPNLGSLGFKLYTGLKAPKDIYGGNGFLPTFWGGYGNAGGINVAGLRNSRPTLEIYSYDDYNTVKKWNEDNFAYIVFNGWAEDESGNTKFMVTSALNVKHSTKKEQLGNILVGVLYDADLDEFFATKVVKTAVNIISYGISSNVPDPSTAESDIPSGSDASFGAIIDPNNTVFEFNSPPSVPPQYLLVFYDAYALMNYYSKESITIAVSALGIYTDDTSISLPSDARKAFAVAAMSTMTKRFGLLIKPFMDIILYAGKTYAVITRFKVFSGSTTSTDLLNWAKKKYPYVISSDEWNSLLSVPPFAVALAGGQPPSGSIPFNISGTPAPGQTISIYGTAKKTNATVWVALMDPDTYTIIAKASGRTDSSGGFYINLTLPNTVTIGKTYRVYIIV